MRYSEAEALAVENAERDQGPYYVICKAIPTAPAGCEYEACDPGKAWAWAQRDGWHLAATILPAKKPGPKCERCGNLLLAFEQRGTVCNACLSSQHGA